MLREEYFQRIKFIVRFGQALHSVGTPAHTLEASLLALCERLGIRGSFISIPTAIFCSFRFLDEEVTRIVRVEPTGVHLARLTQTDQVVQEVIKGTQGFEEGTRRLEEISAMEDGFSWPMRVLCFTLTAAGMLTLFGGSWGDLVAASFLGAVIGVLSYANNFGLVAQLYEVAMAMVAAFVAALLSRVSPDINHGVVILAALIMFVPGMHITIAIGEIATQNLTSGTSRLMGGMMVLLKLAFGVFIGTKFAGLFGVTVGEPPAFERIPEWLKLVSVPLTAAMATVVLKAEKRDVGWVTMAGVLGYSMASLGTRHFGPEMGLFLGGMGVGAAANLFARAKGRPSSIFQFPGIILLVPGSMGYRGLSYLYGRDVVMGFDTAFSMLALAFSLVMGVFLGNMLIRPRAQSL